MNPSPHTVSMSTFTGSYSVQHRALTVPDILLNIFSLLDQSAARQCSLVCRAWREPALAIFWRHLDDPFDFGRLLLPHLVPRRADCNCGRWYRKRIHLHDDEPPSSEDWQRYRTQARRVRSIVVSPHSIMHHVSEDVLELLALEPTTLPLLRHVNLQLGELRTMECPMDLVKIFLHDNIQEITLDFEEADDEWMSGYPDCLMESPEVRTVCRLLQRIPKTATQITRVMIDMMEYILMYAFGKHLGIALSGLHRLVELTASSCGVFEPSLVMALKNLPSLRAILSTSLRDHLNRRPNRSAPRTGARTNGTAYFPSLETLQMYGTLAAVSTAFSREPPHFSNLVYLRLCIPCESDEADLANVIDVLSKPCEQLEDLTVVFLMPHPGIMRSTVTSVPAKWGRMLSLKALKIYCNQCSDDDVVALVERLPKVESLRIGPRGNGSPRRFTIDSDEGDYYLDDIGTKNQQRRSPPRLIHDHSQDQKDFRVSLSVLNRLANIPNNLREITIPIKPDITDKSCAENSLGPYLRKLREVTLSLVTLDDKNAASLARVLAAVLPPDCEIKTLDRWRYQRSNHVLRYVQHLVQCIRLGVYKDGGVFF